MRAANAPKVVETPVPDAAGEQLVVDLGVEVDDEVARAGERDHAARETVVEHSDLGEDAEGVAVVPGCPVAVGGDDVVGQVDADLRGRLHQVTTSERVGCVLGEQVAVALQHHQQATDAVGVDHQRNPSRATRARNDRVVSSRTGRNSIQRIRASTSKRTRATSSAL